MSIEGPVILVSKKILHSFLLSCLFRYNVFQLTYVDKLIFGNFLVFYSHGFDFYFIKPVDYF